MWWKVEIVTEGIMRNEIISIIIITYNQKAYISECINSILKQKTSAKLEILIGDDASEDGTGAVLDTYASQYPDIIHLFHREENIGASANLKDLLERASGDYIAFCEGDDFWTCTEKLERQRNYLGQHPEMSGCVHGIYLVDQDGNLLQNQQIQWIHLQKTFRLEDFGLTRFPGHLSSLMIHNDDNWKKLDKSLLLCDRNKSDLMLFLMVLRIGDIGALDQKMSAYRFVRSEKGNNVTAQLYYKHLSDCVPRMKMWTSMERWLQNPKKLRGMFIDAQSQILITAVFHKLKVYPLSVKEVWALCTHKKMVIAYLPKAFAERLIQKGQILMGLKIR